MGEGSGFNTPAADSSFTPRVLEHGTCVIEQCFQHATLEPRNRGFIEPSFALLRSGGQALNTCPPKPVKA